MSAARSLLVLLVVLSCKHDDTPNRDRDPGPDMIREAIKKSKAFDHVVDLAPAPLTARTDASWSCTPRKQARYDGEGVACVRGSWSVIWELERETSVKPVNELIDAERAPAWNADADANPEARSIHATMIGKAEVAKHHGVFNHQGGGGHGAGAMPETWLTFVGWRGEAGDRTRLSIRAAGDGDPVDVMTLMMTTTLKP